MSSTVYLDYAATSAVRPPEVADAVAAFLRDVGGTPGRSSHWRALEAGRIALRCRRALADLFGVEGDPGRIAFQLNATHALNTALAGILVGGDAVVRTALDHNAVRRPVAALASKGVLERVLPVDRSGRPDLAELSELLQLDGKPAKLLVLPHASNVTGTVFPVTEMAALAHDLGTLVLLDAAQTAGHHPVDVRELGVDMLAFTGHKGLLGPQGIGGLWVREGVDVAPLLHGGTGGDSMPYEMPDVYPDHLEAGTQNAPGMAGLLAGLEWVQQKGVDSLREKELDLKSRLVGNLLNIKGVQLCSPADGGGVGIVTFLLDGLSPGSLARVLEERFGIAGRAGLHCAPEAHAVLGTLETGAYRLSLGWATTTEDVDRVADALRALTNEAGES